MCDPLPLGKKVFIAATKFSAQVIGKIKNNGVIFAALMLLIFGSMVRFFGSQPILYAQAYVTADITQNSVQSPLFEKSQLFADSGDSQLPRLPHLSKGKNPNQSPSEHFAQEIYSLVGETPIREMVPYISKRNDKVAAFLVGIAKKESSFGLASPSKSGRDCYNYWGFKGEGGQGDSMGYACFASAEEAVNAVGDRIQTLVVNKNITTPQAMVDTWKCGTSCQNDPGAPSWVSTVSLYFHKIVS